MAQIDIEKTYEQLREHMRRISHYQHAIALMHWDMEVTMPSGGIQTRSEAVAELAAHAHNLFVSDTTRQLLETLLEHRDKLNEHQRRNVEVLWDDYQRAVRLPESFVREEAQTTSLAFKAWQEAKEKNEFVRFQPLLEKIVDLKRKEADLIGYEEHPYDALLQSYDRGATTAMVNRIMRGVRRTLVPLVENVVGEWGEAPDVPLEDYPEEKVWEFIMFVLKKMGFDPAFSRQDYSPHPFTIDIGRGDVRITTRYERDNFTAMIFSSLHEWGHALYELHLNGEERFLPAGQACSLSIHESQSRLWENVVGRSLPFWEYFYPVLQGYFHDRLMGVSLLDFYRAINRVKPSLIRVNADELTYHLHILIRFELEVALLMGELKVRDLPHEWNARYKALLGVDVPDDRMGVLQDVHWSHGSFGYFPTYSLGSFYAAQLYEAATNAIPDLEDQIRAGEFGALLEWLKKNVYAHGRLLTSEEICERATGSPLSIKSFVRYAKRKYTQLYMAKELVGRY